MYHVAPCKRIELSLGLLIPHCGFRIAGTGFWIFCQWTFDSGIQYLVWSEFLVLYSGFQSLGFWFPQAQAKLLQIPESRFLYMGWNHCSFHQLPKPGVLPQMPLKPHEYTLGDIVFGTHKITEDCESDGTELDTYLPVSHPALMYSTFVLHS